jgi:hypothetical protein
MTSGRPLFSLVPLHVGIEAQQSDEKRTVKKDLKRNIQRITLSEPGDERDPSLRDGHDVDVINR